MGLIWLLQLTEVTFVVEPLSIAVTSKGGRVGEFESISFNFCWGEVSMNVEGLPNAHYKDW